MLPIPNPDPHLPQQPEFDPRLLSLDVLVFPNPNEILAHRVGIATDCNAPLARVERAMRHLPDDPRLNAAVAQREKLTEQAMTGVLDDYFPHSEFRLHASLIQDLDAKAQIVAQTLRDIKDQTKMMSELLNMSSTYRLMPELSGVPNSESSYLPTVLERFDLLSQGQINRALNKTFQVAAHQEFCSERFGERLKLRLAQIAMLASGYMIDSMYLGIAGALSTELISGFNDRNKNRPSLDQCINLLRESQMQFAAETGMGGSYLSTHEEGSLSDLARLRALRLFGELPEYFRSLYLQASPKDFRSLFEEHVGNDLRAFLEVAEGYQAAQNIQGYCEQFQAFAIFQKHCEARL